MKILILGSTGMVGHTVGLYLKERGHDVLGFSRRKTVLFDCVTGDAHNPKVLEELIGINRFDSIINCIGILNREAEVHKEEAVYLNAYLPHLLAHLTVNSDTQIIQLSTDCVFSGERGQYAENDLRDGSTFYDRSKALGELEDNENVTIRTSVVGPDMNPEGIGLLNWFMSHSEKDRINGYANVIWTGLTSLQLAKVMEEAAVNRVHGLYNIVPDKAISKYELLVLFNRYFRNEKFKIVPCYDVASDKSLIRMNRSGFDLEIPDYEKMIAELAEWATIHRTLYPHYFRGESSAETIC